MKRTLALLLLLLSLYYITIIATFSVQQQHFEISIEKRAKDCTFSNSTVKTLLFCLKYCFKLAECFGVNYHSETGLCELLSKKLSKNLLEDDKNYNVYHRKVECNDTPCSHGECASRGMLITDYRAYTCEPCPCGWCGWNCDIINYGVQKDSCIPGETVGSKIVKSTKECMEFCDETPGCKSADYLDPIRECWLNSVDENEAKVHPKCNQYFKPNEIWYLSFNCTCPETV
ncbi:uncharacterized protein [Centruroides vittatus]|uniref:uncharacterized protein n=1 Tax=Centruroides vittatus TaxID=120091 RepID=UPI00350F5C5A